MDFIFIRIILAIHSVLLLSSVLFWRCSTICLCTIYLFIFRATPAAYGDSQARGPIGATAATLRHIHNKAGSKLSLLSTPQLKATPNPQPTE